MKLYLHITKVFLNHVLVVPLRMQKIRGAWIVLWVVRFVQIYRGVRHVGRLSVKLRSRNVCVRRIRWFFRISAISFVRKDIMRTWEGVWLVEISV